MYFYPESPNSSFKKEKNAFKIPSPKSLFEM